MTRSPRNNEIAVAVVGAHLAGQPLNKELRALGARHLETTQTAPDYRLYALTSAKPFKPGMLRVETGKGAAIEVELWAMPAQGFGAFVDSIPAPLTIGTIVLSDGRRVKGFLVEGAAVSGALDITKFGGWRRFLASENFSPTIRHPQVR